MEWKSKLEVEAARLMYQNSTSMDWNPKPLTSKDHGSRQGQSPWQATLAHQAQGGGPQDTFNMFKGAATCTLQSQCSRLFCPAPAFAGKLLKPGHAMNANSVYGGPDVTRCTRCQSARAVEIAPASHPLPAFH